MLFRHLFREKPLVLAGENAQIHTDFILSAGAAASNLATPRRLNGTTWSNS